MALLAEQKGQCDSNMCLPIETPDERLDGKLRRRLWDQKRTFHVFSTLTWEFHCCEWTRQTRYQQLSYVLFDGDFLGGNWLELSLKGELNLAMLLCYNFTLFFLFSA